MYYGRDDRAWTRYVHRPDHPVPLPTLAQLPLHPDERARLTAGRHRAHRRLVRSRLIMALVVGLLLVSATVTAWAIAPARADTTPAAPCDLAEVREQAADRAEIARTGVRR